MRRYRLSAQARTDLDEIWAYVAEDNLSAADGLIDRMMATIRLLADQPGMGRMRDELAASLRGFPVGNYVIFYREHDGGIDIVRVLSGFRDLPAYFLTD